MSAFTSVKSGDCNDPTVWGNPVGGAVPGVGDTVSIGHAVTVPDGFAWVVGTSPATGGAAAIAVTAGSLTVGKTDGASVPASLRVLGPVTQATALVTTFRAGASLTFDATGAADPPNTKYSWTVNYQGRIALGGTASARCKVSSAAGGGNGYISGSGSQTSQIQTSYTDFSRVGDASTNLVNVTPGASPGGCWFLNCTFDSCGTVRLTDNGGTAVFRFEGNVCTNTLGATPLWIAPSSANTTGTRTVKFCGFDKVVNFYPPQDFVIEDNAFGAGWSVAGTAAPASFKRNFVTWAQNNGTPSMQLPGNVSGVYFYPTGGTNPHICVPSTSFTALAIDSCLFEYGGTSADGDDILLPAPAAVSTYTITRCIKLPNAAGLSSGTLFSGLGNGNCRVVCEHNTIHGGGGGDSSGGRVGETFPSFTGQVLSVRGNLYWDTTPRGYVFFDMSASPAQDAITAANCDYNGKFNAGTDNCTVGGVTTAVLGYRGLNVSGSTPPGAHDVVGDPRFVNPAACLRTWGAARAGTDGSASAAIAALLANPSLVADLLAWVRAGFVVTNPAFVAPAGGGLAFPGDAMTSDAAGNPLGGTLGALAYQAPAVNRLPPPAVVARTVPDPALYF